MPAMRRSAFISCVALAAISVSLNAQEMTLPLKANSVRFAAIGDMGNGGKEQYAVAGQMLAYRAKFPFEFVLMLGDNLIGGKDPSDYQNKFELPYKALLDAGVKFYAVFGNHDISNERFYKLFNMNGQAILHIQEKQRPLLRPGQQLHDPTAARVAGKGIAELRLGLENLLFPSPTLFFRSFHGSSVELRLLLEPLFIKYGVQVVFAGHEHIYERVKPQNGIIYFTEGASGELRKGNLTKTNLTAAGYDQDRTFMLVRDRRR